ncbi:hypothetical protein LP419_30715 [Massilia sp. H-1]|nr:hypothetical protein LP419_30715 [Massilia sp. H-1]
MLRAAGRTGGPAWQGGARRCRRPGPAREKTRRRLVGAVALALAVAIGLPMILDSEPKPLATDIDIRIPSKDKALSPGPAAPRGAPGGPGCRCRFARQARGNCRRGQGGHGVDRAGAAGDRAARRAQASTDAKPADVKLLSRQARDQAARQNGRQDGRQAKRQDRRQAARQVGPAPKPSRTPRALAILEDKPLLKHRWRKNTSSKWPRWPARKKPMNCRPA